MDVNSVLQNTRQYFRGIPSGSPASGELAPGASVGYSSPPVSSTASSVAAPPSSGAASGYGAPIVPYNGGRFGPVSSAPPPPTGTWSTQPQTSPHNAYQHLAPATNGPRFTPSAVSTSYHHFYERSQKSLPSTSNPSYVVPPQHAYASPSVTRLKEQGVNNQGMFNMDSIVCQPNANYAYGKKNKPKSTTAPSSANVYKQPTQLDEQRYFNHHPSPATRVPAVVPHHVALAGHQRPPEMPINHQSFSHQSVIEQRVGYQQQVSYHASSVMRTTAEKVTASLAGAGPTNQQRSTGVTNNGASVAPGEPVDVRYYVNRRVETTALQASPAVAKRDSPLDLSVKTIRQSADSTAHDDAEGLAALYNHHHPHHHHHAHLQHNTAPVGYALQQRDHGLPPMRPAGPPAGHLAQLPYAGSTSTATAAVSLPNNRSHSNPAAAAFSVTHQRTQHYPSPPQLPPNASTAVYPTELVTPYWNGQLQEHHDKGVAIAHPAMSEYRREKTTISFTIEKKEEIHRTHVNAEVSSMRFASSHQFYPHAADMAAGKLKSSPPQPPFCHFSGLPNAQTKPALPAAPSPTPNSAPSRKRKPPEAPSASAPSPMKNPRVSLEWRENINKEIENRLNAYTTMKAREQQEKDASKSGPGLSPSESYRDIVPSTVASPSTQPPQATPSPPQPPPIESVLRSNLEKERNQSPVANAAYLEQQKAQHRLPVQPIHPYPQWYSGQHRGPANTAMQTFKPPRTETYPNHAVKFSKSSFETRDLKIIEKVELKPQQTPLPPFHAFSRLENSSTTTAAQLNSERRQEAGVNTVSDGAPADEKVASDGKKESGEDGQSRAALMASAAAHPRFRTKAELKQVTPVDKSKDKTNAENTNVKLPEAQSNKKSRSHFDSGPKLFANAKGFNSDSHHANHTRVPSSDFEPEGGLLSPESPSNLVIDLGKQLSPRKRSSDSEDETIAGDVHSLNDMRKDRKTRTPPSGTVTPPTVIDQLNEEPTDDSKWLEACDELIQQFSNGGQKKRGRKKKAVVKFTTAEDDPPAPSLLPPPPPAPSSTPPALSSSKLFTDSSSDSEDDKPLRPSKIKKEAFYDSDDTAATVKPAISAETRVKKEQIEDESEEEDNDDDDGSDDDDEDAEEEEDDSDESDQSSDSDSSYGAIARKYSRSNKRADRLNGTVELRGQRSNTSTTRIRIQNSLEDSSAAESSDTDDSYKAPIKKTPLRKAKVIRKKKKLPKSKMITRKNTKIMDRKREKVRHMMLRRMETRKSRMDATKTSKSTKKTRTDSTTSEEQQPIMTRKMTRQECQREKSRVEELRGKKASSTKKPIDDKSSKSKDKSSPEKSDDKSSKSKDKLSSEKSDDKSKPKSDRPKDEKPAPKAKDEKTKKDKPEEKGKPKPEEKSKPKKEEGKVKSRDKSSDESSNQKSTHAKQNEEKTPAKPSTKDTPTKHHNKSNSTPTSAKKDSDKATPKQLDKSKKSPQIKTEPKDQPIEDVTRRSLRSRNIVVDEKNPSPVKKSSPKKPAAAATADPAKSKSPTKSKNDERKKPPPAPPPVEKPPTWEEELFKYKCSLRMPVKLINIAKPTNWPKNNGGASSLPDLDRSESDSDLLNDCPKQAETTPKKRNKDESKVSNTKEFKDSVKFLKEKFDKKIEEHKATSLTQLMIENKIKIIPRSSDGPELLPTPSLDSLKSKLNNKSESAKKNNGKKSKESAKTDDDEKEEIVEDSLIGYFRKETVDVYKEVFEKHQVANQFKTVILESRTRTQTKEMKHNATLKQVFGCDRPASAPPVSDSTVNDDGGGGGDILRDKKVKTSTNGCLKGWHKSFAKIKLLVEEENRRGDEKNGCKDYEDTVDFSYEDATAPAAAVVITAKDNNEPEIENVVKRKSRSFRRKCRSSGFDYIRKKKKQKKEEDDEIDDKERKKPVAPIRPTPESIEDIQNEIRSWVVNKGIGETVLHKAARLGYSDISSYCLEKMNCTPSPTDNAGYTPLHEACTRGHLKIAKMLLKYGADVSASAKGGIRPLHEAVEHGNVELVRLLLAYGADPLLSTYAGQTPLSLVKDDQDDLKQFLLLYLADIQGAPSKPWPFLGFSTIDEENCGYDPLTDCPPPSPADNLTSYEFEISDTPLPTLYRFKNDPELWMVCSDLPAKIRDSITKKAAHPSQPSEQNVPAASQYVTKKITRAEFEENVECASFLDYKFSPKTSKSKATYVMVKYNDKLLAALSIQKLTMSFNS